MFRTLLIIAIVFSASMSWALDWNVCHKDLESLRKMSRTESNRSYLTAASDQAVKLRDLYEDIEAQRFRYNWCKSSADGTQYCVYMQGRLNAMLGEYQDGRNDFNNMMMSSGKYSQAKEEPCGFKLN